MASRTQTVSDGEDSHEDDGADHDTQLSRMMKVLSLQANAIHFSDASDEIHSQTGGICWAYAVSTVLRAAESRIVGRSLIPHSDLVRQLVEVWGRKGRSSELVLSVECPRRKLKFQECTSVRAVDIALSKNRTLLARFWLDDTQWERFSHFFKKTPKGVLTKKVVGPRVSGDTTGHAMAIRGTTKHFWILKNSWGDWDDGGYCKVAKDAFDWKIYDVYYVQRDLSKRDWANYRRYDGDKCTARSIAMVIRAAAARVVGRKTKSLYKLKNEILTQLQKEHKSLTQLLQSQCSRRRLRFRKLAATAGSGEDEGTVISEQRPLLCVVEMSEANWNRFVRGCIDDKVHSIELREDKWMNNAATKKSYHLVVVEIASSVYKAENPWFNGNDIRDRYKFLDFAMMKVGFYDVFFYQHELTGWNWANYQKVQLGEHLINQSLQQ